VNAMRIFVVQTDALLKQFAHWKEVLANGTTVVGVNNKVRPGHPNKSHRTLDNISE